MFSIKKNVSIDTSVGDTHRRLRDADDDYGSSQSPKGTPLPHPDMQCQVFILRWAEPCMPQP